jgi:ABC-type sugar transport system ATPase subunit
VVTPSQGDAGEGARPASAGRAPAAEPAASSGSPAVTDPGTAAGEPLLRLAGVGKHFGPVEALAAVDLQVPAGQVTALVGDNGAGKTTLIKCIAGIWPPSTGQIYWHGRPVQIHSPKDAARLGIATVYQDLALCDNLDIVANMMLGREKKRGGLLDEIQMEKTARQTLADLAVTTVRSVRQPVGSLSGGQRQSVAVAKAVMQEAQLVIMDEPTAALGVSQTELVLSLITRLAERGHAVIVISHNLNDVFRVADRFAVLYLGRLVAVGPAADFDRQSVVDLMTTGTTSRPVNGGSAGATAAVSGSASGGEA